MEDRTINCLGGGVLQVGRGMQVDPVVYLDRIFSDGSGDPNHWVILQDGRRLFPYTTGLELAQARALRDALSEAIEDAELRHPTAELRVA